jgi:chemotaxis protein CheX
MSVEVASAFIAKVMANCTGKIRAEFVNPFLQAAYSVLRAELRMSDFGKGEITLQASSYTSEEVTVLVGVVGELQGVVLYSMSERTAKNMTSTMLGVIVPVFDRTVESAIAELGNVITGAASQELEKAGFACRLTPPMVISGRGAIISTVSIQRLVVPVLTSLGAMEINVALREAASDKLRVVS